MREDFKKVERPHTYKGAMMGKLEIPITLVRKDGQTLSSKDWRRDQSLMHPLEVENEWAGDAMHMMYRQIEQLRHRSPEVLHCFGTLGGRIFITEGNSTEYDRHVLGNENVEAPKDGTFTYGFATASKKRSGTVFDICIDSRGVFHNITGRGAEHTTFVHEIAHILDYDTRGVIGRFSKTDLMKAVLNVEINSNPDGVSADIQSRIQHYDRKDQLVEYLPRLLQQYLADKESPKYKKLSNLETALIEKVFLPDAKLRANNEIAKAAVLRTEYSRGMDEILLGVYHGLEAYLMDSVLRDPPTPIGTFKVNKRASSALETIRESLLDFVDAVPENAADYCERLEQKRVQRQQTQECDQAPA